MMFVTLTNTVNPLSLISTIVDGMELPYVCYNVNPLSLISTIVDLKIL